MGDRDLVDEPTSGENDDDLVMAMLGQHLPLALLVDLTDADGPESEQIFTVEGVPENRWWEH